MATIFSRLRFQLWRTGFWLVSFFVEWLYVLFRAPALLPALWRTLEWSIFRSPYKASQELSEELTYGEILLPTLHRLLRHLEADEGSLLLDLGCGRGRVVMFSAALSIPARGIELLPELLEAARYAAGDDLPLATFQQGDFLTAALDDATILWVVGTCWSEDTRIQLAKRIAELPTTPTVVSVSGPLPLLDTQEILHGWTSWGRDRFYLQSAKK